MANWKRVLTEADLGSGTNVISAVNGSGGISATYDVGGNIATLSVDVGDGVELSDGTANATLQLDLDGTTLDLGSGGVKVRAGGITNTEVAASIVSGHSGLNAAQVTGTDTILLYDASATALRQMNLNNLASYISTASGGDYDLDLVNITNNEVSEIRFILDSDTIEKRIRFVNQANETTVTFGSNGGHEAIYIGLADDVQIDETLEVNTEATSGEVFRVHAHATTATSAVFETDVTIQGNLTVNGDTTETVVDTLNVEDSTFIINSDPTGTPISTGGMIVKIDNTSSSQADVLWLDSAQLSGWTVRNLHDYPGLTGGVELSVMEFKAGAPASEEVFGAGSFMYDTTNNELYVNLA